MRRLITLALLLLCQSAWSWGPQGHMVVAEIAQNHLTPAAKKKVTALLVNQSMADVANWADFIKNDPAWQKSKPWHFVDIPDNQDYARIPHSHEGDVVTAITEMVAIMKNPKSTVLDQQNALKFVIHFVGDLHQPLHVGRPEDKGGNLIKVSFEGRQMNLHSLWDSAMITKQNMDYKQYANYLDRGAFANYDIPEFSFSGAITECMGARKEIYNFKDAKQIPIQLDAVYMKRNLELMNAQLLSGGKRLADILNKVLK